jgi:hypothetical protein
LRLEFEQLLTTKKQSEIESRVIMTLTRQLVLFYQPKIEKDNIYLESYISLLLSPGVLNEMYTIKDKEVLDSWIWLTCLLIKKVLLQSLR